MNKKRLLFSIAASCIFCGAMALNHGSISVKNAQLYPQIENQGANLAQPLEGKTASFKLVTIGNTTWAWTELFGDNIMGETYSSQLRWWQPGKVENNLTGRIANTQQTYGKVSSLPGINPVTITFLQHSWEWEFRETENFTYDYTAKNSANAADVTAPVLAEPVIASQTATSLALSLSAADASGDFFYYIEDAAHSYAEVFFGNQPVLPLAEGTDYAFSIKAIDFSGNESEAKIVNVTGQAFVCNNLLENKTLSLGTVFYATGNEWATSTNYTADVSGTSLTVHLGDATIADWQAQFPVLVTTPLAVTPGEKYSLVMDVDVSVNARIYAKFMDANDNVFLEIPRQTVNAGGTVNLAVYDLTCPAALTQISQILFDFGGSPAVDFNISNISVCGEGGSGIVNANLRLLEVYPNPAKNILNINGLEKETTVTVSGITGKTVMRTATTGELNVSALSSGIYILNIENRMVKFLKK
ncbi:MAG: T9SS type A sorting domain-containing protein [Dysgonamonadaceae bacterium]|jgi:hypothetical protein|nr:T9SS type A sorting domain-containing protein [Dysgonamonadaceae bacterium]